MANPSNFVLHWVINNASATLATGQASSQEWLKGGFKWTVDMKQDGGWSDMTVKCVPAHYGSWYCEADVEIAIMKVEGTWKADEKGKFTFNANNSSTKYINCNVWDYLSSAQMYKINDKVFFEIRIKIIDSSAPKVIINRMPSIDNVDFSKFLSPIETSNVTLIIGAKKLEVSKEYLSMHSPVLKQTFLGAFLENGKKEVELKDVEYENFVALLLVFFPGTTDISDETVLPILELADRFFIERVLDLAEKHLVTSTNFTNLEKMKIADDYRLVKLRRICLQSYTNVNEIKLLKNTEFFTNFSKDMKAALCERIMEIL